MAKPGVTLMFCLLATAVVITVTSAQSCKACNCQFNNIQALSSLIEAQVNRILANEPRKFKQNTIFIAHSSNYSYNIMYYI